jgi:hypothetical protein
MGARVVDFFYGLRFKLLWPLAKSQQLNPIFRHQISQLFFKFALIILWNKSWPQIIWVVNTHIGRSLIRDKDVPMYRPHLPKHGGQTCRNWFIHSFQILCDKHSCFFFKCMLLGRRGALYQQTLPPWLQRFFLTTYITCENTYIPTIMLQNHDKC